MTAQKFSIVIHPVRLRLLQALQNDHLTTQELADQLPSIPKSSIYRHLKVLLAEGFVEVVDTRSIKGTLEKVYGLARSPHLSLEDMKDLSKDEHLHFFIIYLADLLKGYSDFIETTALPDILEQKFGYSDINLYATDAEMELFFAELNRLVIPLNQASHTPERSALRFSSIVIPVKTAKSGEGDNHA